MKKKPITEVVEEQIIEAEAEQAPVAEEPIIKKYIGTATERVNVRALAKLDSDIVTVLDKEATIPVTAKRAVNGFYPVEGGFIKKEYLKVKEI